MFQRLGGLLRSDHNKRGSNSGPQFDDLRTAVQEGDENVLDTEFGAIPSLPRSRTKPGSESTKLSGRSDRDSSASKDKRLPLQPKTNANVQPQLETPAWTESVVPKAERPRSAVPLTPLLRRHSDGDISIDTSPIASPLPLDFSEEKDECGRRPALSPTLLMAAAFAPLSPVNDTVGHNSRSRARNGSGLSDKRAVVHRIGIAVADAESLTPVSSPLASNTPPLVLLPPNSPFPPRSANTPTSTTTTNTSIPPTSTTWTGTAVSEMKSPGYVRPLYESKGDSRRMHSSDDSGVPGLISPADFRFKSGRMRGQGDHGDSSAARLSFMASPKKPSSMLSHYDPAFAPSPHHTRYGRKGGGGDFRPDAKHSYGDSKGDDLYANGEYSQEDSDVEVLFSKVRHNRVEFVLNAFRQGCDPRIRDGNGNTLLHVCAQNNLRKLARECIRFGCDVNAVNNRGMTALDCSDRLQFARMSELLVIEGGENAVLGSDQGGMDRDVVPLRTEAEYAIERGERSSSAGEQNFYTTRGMR